MAVMAVATTMPADLSSSALAVTTAIIEGTSAADTMRGTAQADVMKGLEGGDAIHGRSGDDLLHGDAGSDALYGGPGADMIFSEGDGKVDVVDCGAGVDTAMKSPEEQLDLFVGCENFVA